MNSANFMDAQNPLFLAYQLSNQPSKDLLLSNPKSVLQIDSSIASPPMVTLKETALSFNNQVSSLNPNHYIPLNRSSQASPAESFFHAQKSLSSATETFYNNISERILSSSLASRNLKNNLSNLNLLQNQQHWPSESRSSALLLSPSETSPNILRQQNPLEEIIMAHLHGQSTLSSSVPQNSLLYSQYTKPQSQSNTLNSVGNSKPALKTGEEINQIPSPNSNKASVSKIGNAETPTLQLEATTPLEKFVKDQEIEEEVASEEKSGLLQQEAEPNPLHIQSHRHQTSSNSLMEEEKVPSSNHKEDLMESEEVEDSDSDHNNLASATKVLKVEPLKKKVRICLNICCLTDGTEATLWCRQKVRNSNICKQCFEAFKKEQYCYFCFQIYDDNSSYSDGKDWIECDSCNHWHHLDCEANHGIKNIQEVKDDANFKYTCPRCRLPAEPKSSGQKPKAHHHHSHHKSKLEILEQSTKKQHIQEFILESQTIVDIRAPVHDSPIDDIDPEDIITKKLKLNPEIQEENYVTIPVPREILPVVFTQKDFIKKKLDSTINRALFNKKKIPVKVPLALSEFATEIERLMSYYGGRKLQLSENEIKADLNLFRELSGSTCTTDEKSSRSGEQIMEKVIDMWDEQSRSDYGEEERYPRRNNIKVSSQSKILRSNKKIVVPVEPIFQEYNFEVREKTRGGRGRKRGKGRGGRHPSKKIL